MKKIYKIHEHLYVGLSGLASDQMTLVGHPARVESRSAALAFSARALFQ